ncbi:MAG: hypothetical protein ACR2MG_10815 [Pyrinomonadaceae bacterium]
MNPENKGVLEEYLTTQNQETNELSSLKKKDFYKNVNVTVKSRENNTYNYYEITLGNFNNEYFSEKAKDFEIDNIYTDGWEDALIEKILDEYAEAVAVTMRYKKPESNEKAAHGFFLTKDSEFLVQDLSKLVYEKKDGEIIKHSYSEEYVREPDIIFVLSDEGYKKITGKTFDSGNKEFPILSLYEVKDKRALLHLSETVTPTYFTDKALQEVIKEKWKLAE